MAVEDDARAGLEQAEEGYAGAELVDEEGRGGEPCQFAGEEGNLQDQVQLAEDGTEDGEAPEDGGGDESVAAHAHIEGSFAPASGLSCRLHV